MWTVKRPLSTAGRPSTVNEISSCAPARGSPVFSAGWPSGLAIAIGPCGGPSASRPSRPATTGRVDGLTFHSNVGPSVTIEYSSVSENSWTGPMSVPKSLFQIGEVSVMNDLRIFSVEPVGAEPSMTE